MPACTLPTLCPSERKVTELPKVTVIFLAALMVTVQVLPELGGLLCDQ
jgi:hypothetical protein